VTVFTNNGFGVFTSGAPLVLPQLLGPETPAVSLILADLSPAPATAPPLGSPTGPLDILVPDTNVNGTINAFTVLTNKSSPGKPTFTIASYQVDNVPVALTVGNGGASNDGAITIVEAGKIVAGRNGVGTNGGDINGDGIPDVVTVNIGNVVANLTGRSITVARGVGDGTFLDPLFVPSSPAGSTFIEKQGGTPSQPINPAPSAIAVGDLNGDGIPDYVVADSGLNQVEVYLATAPGEYADPVTYTVSITDAKGVVHGNDPISITLADLTGTGKLDIVVADNADNFISILSNKGDGTFGAPTLIPVGEGPTQVIAGLFATVDANGNPKTAEDLLVAHNGSGADTSSQGVTALINANGLQTTLSAAIDNQQTSIPVVSTVGLPATGNFFVRIDSEILLVTAVRSTTLTVQRGVNGSLAASHLSGAVVQVLFLPAIEYGAGKHATAIASGDFNADGNLDFAFTDGPLNGAGAVIVMLGDGKGHFTQEGNPFPVAANPSALAVADLTNDGYADIIVGSQSPNPNTAIGVLLNTVGDGFQPAIYTALPNDTPVNSLAVTNLNENSPGGYPDLVVGTQPVALSSPLPVVDNVFTLQGVGDGTFVNPLPYEAGGPPSPATAVVISDPLVRATTFFMGGTLVSTNLVVNGTFDVRDLNQAEGNLVGWQTTSVLDSHGSWDAQTATSAGSFSPLSQVSVPLPDGLYQAMLDEPNLQPLPLSQKNPNLSPSYAGSNFLYQDVTIPANVTAAVLSLRLTIDNFFTSYQSSGLDYRTLSPDQQVRVDIMDPTASITSTTVHTASTPGIYLFPSQTPGQPAGPVFVSNQGTPLDTIAPLFITVPDLTSLAGQTVRIRIAVVDNQGKLVVGVDDVRLQVTYNDTGSASDNPTVNGPQLRNPGYLSGLLSTSTTTDPTLTGRVGDGGGIGNVAFIGFDPNPAGGVYNPSDPNVFKTNFFDAVGNFSVTLPNLPQGLNTIGVRVQDVAGNTHDTTMQFIVQGPSLTSWQAVGPGAVNVTAEAGITYTSVTGTVTAVATDPSDPSGNSYYVGSDNGGVWKTIDGGNDWTPLTDAVTDQNGNAINVPIGAIAVDPANPSLIYAATGTGNTTPVARGSVGILVSPNSGLTGTWTVVGTSGTVFAGARITTIAVDDNGIVYVAVASGGQSGPGVYRSTDNGKTWTNILTIASLILPNGFAALPAGTTIASVTSLVIDPRNTHDVTIGLGNIGLAANSITGGVWKSSNADSISGTVTWTPVLGGDNKALTNGTLPSDLLNTPATVKVGRVTLVEGYATPTTGPGSNISTYYVLIGNPTPTNPVTGGLVNYGNATGPIGGLYKSSDAGLNWTKVMLRANTAAAGAAPSFQDINLLGNGAGNVGALVLDATDANVVYVGGADNAAQSFGLIRVDTGDMRDTTYVDPTTGKIPNDGDDIAKAAAAEAAASKYPDGTAYTGEGVSWYDLESNRYSPNPTNYPKPSVPAARIPGVTTFFSETPLSRLPAEVTALAVDPVGRLIIGTQEGVWRADYHGAGYDYTSGGTGILAVTNQAGVPPVPAVNITTINGNLQIADLTSVANDPLLNGQFYASAWSIGTFMTTGGLNWQTMGLNGPAVGPAAGTSVDAGVVAVASPDPTAPFGTPTTVYRDFAFISAGTGYFPEANTQSGALSAWGAAAAKGISQNDNAAYFPVLVVDPTKIFNSGVYQDLLIFGTDRIYTSFTSTNKWDDRVGHPLSSVGGVVTAAAVAPSNTGVYYAGTNLGEVFASLDNGATWPQVGVGTLPAAPVTGITVNPTNPDDVFVTFGGTGVYSHIWRSTNGGQTWNSLQGDLPAGVPVYSVVDDPRPQLTNNPSDPGLPAPFGHIYIGTEIGVFFSLDNGATWKKLGVGLPNVPAVGLQFNPTLEQLTVATQGRGAFVISTDRTGPHVGLTVPSLVPGQPPVTTTVTPTTPVAANPGLSSVTVTFNKAINDASFTPAQVDSISGPNGVIIWNPATSPAGTITVTDVSVTPPGQSNPHNTFQITFPTQTTDGIYYFVIGPNITDLVGNSMDQNQNGINGEPGQAPIGDEYPFQVVVNSTDDGQFLTGLYHDVLQQSAPTAGFIYWLSQFDAARFAQLPAIAANFVSSTAARTQLISDLLSSSSPTLSSLGIGNLIPSFSTLPASQQQATIAYWEGVLNQTGDLEGIINTFVSVPAYFNKASIAGSDAAFVPQLLTDLLGTQYTAQPGNFATLISNDLALLAQNEQAARTALTIPLLNSAAYFDTFITNAFQVNLGRLPDSAPGVPGTLSYWEGQMLHGLTEQQFLAILMNSGEFYNDAPQLLNDPAGTPATDTTFIDAVYQQLLNGAQPTSTELANGLAALANGMSHFQFVLNLTGTTPYLDTVINTYFQQLLPAHNGGNGPTAADFQYWEGQLEHGVTIQNMVATILASPEFFADQSPAGTTDQGILDSNWDTAIYQDTLGPGATPGANDIPSLQLVEQNTRLVIAQGVTSLAAYRTNLVTMLYANVIAQPPTASDLSYWTGVLAGPASGPGLSRDEQVLAAFLGCPVSFYAQTENGGPTDPLNGLHTNTSWVDSLYAKLDLPFNATDAANRVTALLNAYQPQRTAVVQAFVTCPTYRSLVATQDITQYLRMTPTAAQVDYWSAQLQTISREQEIAAYMATPTYFNLSPSILGVTGQPTINTFVRAVYQDTFATSYVPTQADIDYWVSQLTSGAITPEQFALVATTSTHNLFDIASTTHGVVNALYNRFLGINTPPDQMTGWEYNYAHGARDEDVIVYLLQSPAYFFEKHQFP